MDPDTRLSVPPQVLSRLVGDETVLLDLASGLYFGLDGVGKLVWESLADGKSLAETANVVSAEYDVDAERARADVVTFVDELVARGLLVLDRR